MDTELQAWLAKSACLSYTSKFMENGVTFDLVPELDTAALREIGVYKLGDRLRLELAIAELRLELLLTRIPIDHIQRAVESYAPESSDLDASENTIVGELPARLVTFILPDGSIKKVNVEGCFNAQLIKRKVLKKLGVRGRDHEYDTYIHSTGTDGPQISGLYDVEFVTICFSPDRPEKHRIMLTPKNEEPTATAAEQSLRILQRMAGRQLPALRNFFGQRPPSELILSNLGEYFPTAPQQDLEATIRNSVRYLVRLLRRFRLPGSSLVMLAKELIISDRRRVTGRTIGDMMVHNASMLEEAINPGDVQLDISKLEKDRAEKENSSFDDRLVHSQKTAYSRHRFSVATLFASARHRYSRIELMSVDSDDDSFLDDYGDFCEEEAFIPGKKWLQGARIGAGSFGTVYLGMDPVTGELMAVKQVPIAGSKHNDLQRAVMEALHHEMSLLKELNHENIVRYYGLSAEGNFLNIFLEYVPGGLVQSMLRLYGPFEEPLIRNFVRQVLVGLSYLHSVDIIHRDIKGANILIDIKGTVKISDFGISKKVDPAEEDGKLARRASLQGLVYWMAPEVVKQTAYTKKADIWSVGCLVVEMFTGKHPFPNFSQMQAIFKIGTHTQPQVPECTAEGKEFMSKTFEFDYDKRPDAVELLAEPFMNPLIVSHAEE